MKRVFLAYLPAVAWAAFVLVVGGLPAVRAPSFFDFPGADKVAHFGLYGVLGALLLVGRHLARSRHPGAWPLLVVAIMAAGDEARQGAVPGRSPEVTDWVTDVLGAGAGFLVAGTLLRSKERGRRDES